MELDLFQNALFVFCNRRKDSLKLLYWDGNGFCLWQKKLDKDRFPFPDSAEEMGELDRQRFLWLLRGIDFRREHKVIEITKAI